MTDPLRYPIGRFEPPPALTDRLVSGWIDDIDRLPVDLRAVVEPLSRARLDTPYRPGGWTVRQVVHHVGDSHLNAYVRCKWALTEDRPTIKPYDERRWAALADYDDLPVAASLDVIQVLHRRWVVLLRGVSGADLARELVHPDTGPVTLGVLIGSYAWHGRHHLAHITTLARREGWDR